MNPAPVDLNKLKNILGNAKAVMQKVETGNFETGHIDARALTEEGINEMQASGIVRPATQASQVAYDEQTIQNSKLPEAVKKLMLERPIPQLTNPSYTFSLNDVAELAEDKPMALPKIPKTKPVQNVIRESAPSNSGLITISKEQLSEMVSSLVNEKLLEFFTKNYNKMMTEDTVKKTISMLIKEGRLVPKKKTL